MSRDRSVRWPADLALVGVLAVGAMAALLVPAVPLPVKWLLGVPLLIFLPGYALVAALYPESRDQPARSERSPDTPGWAVRAALSLAASAVVVAVVGVLLNWTAGIRLDHVAASVAAVTVVGVAAAAVRRLSLAPDRRAAPLSAGRFDPFRSVGGLTRIQAVVTLLAVGLLVGTVAFAGAAPPQEEPYSEFYLLTEGANETLVADGYPAEFGVGEPRTVYVAVENHEGQDRSYDVVVLAQAVDSDGTVTDRERLDRFDVRVPAGERVVVPRDLVLTTTGERVRVQFLLYQGSMPDDPDRASADLAVHFWTSVTEEG